MEGRGKMSKEYDVYEHVKKLWKKNAENKNHYTIPINSEDIEEARKGNLKIYLTRNKLIPRSWFPQSLTGLKVLALASGGGQQGPLLAAAGADVTVLDSSPQQLEQDRVVAEKEKLSIKLIEGDMCKLYLYFEQEYFDLIINPASSMYIKDINAMYKGVEYVCKPGGLFMTAFINPAFFLFDHYKMELGIFEAKYKIPYNPFEQLNGLELTYMKNIDCEIAFGHSLTELIGYQLEYGFNICGFYLIFG